MTEREEFKPKWNSNGLRVVPGTYIWTVYVKSCVFKEANEKPFMLIGVIVEDPAPGIQEPFNGLDFDFRVYMNAKSAGWCQYFLKKFGYPENLLGGPDPTIRRSEIIGSHGKIWVNVVQGDSGYLNFDVKGFDHLGGEDLEKRLAGKSQVSGTDVRPFDNSIDAPEQVVDLQEDVKISSQQDMKEFVDSCDPKDALDDL